MAGDTSLIDIGKLSEPATKLIEKVSDAVGGIAKPWQTERVAKAEAKAEIIKAQTRVEISEIEKRGLQRLAREEGRKQENIESITAQAAQRLSLDATPDQMDTDWLTYFFERAKLISDDEMQTFWSNLLANEANEPGTFSKITVNLASTLDKSDAQLFTNFCTCVWKFFDGFYPVAFEIDSQVPGLEDENIHFENLEHLSSLGLLTHVAMGYAIFELPKSFEASYFDRNHKFILAENSENSLPTGNARFTQSGEQLFQICGAEPSSSYLDRTITYWASKNVKVSEAD